MIIRREGAVLSENMRVLYKIYGDGPVAQIIVENREDDIFISIITYGEVELNEFVDILNIIRVDFINMRSKVLEGHLAEENSIILPT